MSFLARNRFVLLFMIIAVICSVMVVRQITANRVRHLEVREAFILLHASGQLPQAQRLYQWLIEGLQSEPLQNLLEDRQRLGMLLDPAKPQPDSQVWRLHRSISNELEKRGHSSVARALRLADEIR